MKCKDCPAGKKITRRSHGCVECIPYGMILLESHECGRPAARKKEDPPVLPTPEEMIGGPQDEPEIL